MSKAIQHNSEETLRLIKSVVESVRNVEAGLKPVKAKFEEAYRTSNLEFLKAVTDVFDKQGVQLRKLVDLADSLEISVRKYDEEVERFGRSGS